METKRIAYENSTIFILIACLCGIILIAGCLDSKNRETCSLDKKSCSSKEQVDAKSPRDLKALQEDFLDLKFGFFACFDIANYVEYGHTNGYEDPMIFNPKKLDCGQWADVAKAAHMSYAILTVKNTNGWCLWDSAYTTHDITQAKDFKNGKGDVVREFVDAFRERDMKVGFYYCFPGNFSKPNLAYQRTVPEGKPNLYAMPPEAKGNEFEFLKKQFVELMENYGPIDFLWIDQFTNVPKIAKRWVEFKAFINERYPNCLVIGNNARKFEITDIISYERPMIKAKVVPPFEEGNTEPAEVCDSVYNTIWFWEEGVDPSKGYTSQEAVDYLDFCNKNNANYLYCIPIDRDGLISGPELDHMVEIAKILDERSN